MLQTSSPSRPGKDAPPGVVLVGTKGNPVQGGDLVVIVFPTWGEDGCAEAPLGDKSHTLPTSIRLRKTNSRVFVTGVLLLYFLGLHLCRLCISLLSDLGAEEKHMSWSKWLFNCRYMRYLLIYIQRFTVFKEVSCIFFPFVMYLIYIWMQ